MKILKLALLLTFLAIVTDTVKSDDHVPNKNAVTLGGRVKRQATTAGAAGGADTCAPVAEAAKAAAAAAADAAEAACTALKTAIDAAADCAKLTADGIADLGKSKTVCPASLAAIEALLKKAGGGGDAGGEPGEVTAPGAGNGEMTTVGRSDFLGCSTKLIVGLVGGLAVYQTLTQRG